MIAILWRYRVHAHARTEFEAAYGAAGEWAQLFAKAPGFLGTELLQGGEGDYLTIDRWRDASDFDAFLAAHGRAYEALDRATEGWTLDEQRIGSFAPLD